jgi:hypothetical protein
MVRGTGKFKQKRGGGRSFSKNMVLDENGTAVGVDRRRRKEDVEEDSDDSDDSEEDEEDSEEGSEEDSEAEDKPELTRAERKALKKQEAEKKKGKATGKGASSSKAGDDDEDDDDLINPNHVKQSLNISDLGAPRELSRREREQKEKQDAKDRYWKLHVQGKTDEAKSDLARLAKIRQEREAAQARRKAEAEAKTNEIEAKKQAAASGRRI